MLLMLLGLVVLSLASGAAVGYTFGKNARDPARLLGDMPVEAHRVGVSLAAGAIGGADRRFAGDLRAAPLLERWRLFATDVRWVVGDGGDRWVEVVGSSAGTIEIGPCEVTDAAGAVTPGQILAVKSTRQPAIVVLQVAAKVGFGCIIRG